jgi:hypothetical protein
MSKFDVYYESLQARQRRLKEGIPTIIPITFPSLSKFIPGIIRGDVINLTAGSGIGKSRLCRKMFIRDIIEFAEHAGLKVKIFLNSLEEDEPKVISTIIANDLYKRYGIQVNYFELNNYALKPMSDELEAMVQTSRQAVDDYQKYVDIIHIGNPTGVYKYVIDYLFSAGTFLKNGNILTEVKYHSSDWLLFQIQSTSIKLKTTIHIINH